jgi:hypothetical protein
LGSGTVVGIFVGMVVRYSVYRFGLLILINKKNISIFSQHCVLTIQINYLRHRHVLL